MKTCTLIMVLMLGLTFSHMAFAADPYENPSAKKKDVEVVMKRGWTNLFTFPGEVVRTAKSEKQNHPKAWPLTYTPRLVSNLIIRVTSSVNDMFILPTYVSKIDDPRPITRFFDMPDYVWEKV